MKIKTVTMQTMMTKAIKGVGNNKLLPLTCLIALEVKDGIFTITSTDNVNYLYVTEQIDSTDDFYVCIRAEQFAKLISKLTSEYVELTIKDNSLSVVANGNYKIEIPNDEMGEVIKYPNPVKDFSFDDKIGTLTLANIGYILNSVKSGLATTIEAFPYTNYYIGDRAIATDSIKISGYNAQLFSKPQLVTASTMDLLETMSDDAVDVYVADGKIVFKSSNVTVYGMIPEGIDTYSIDAINNLVAQEFPNTCKVTKSGVLQLLDRIALFVDAYDDGAIRITFNKDSLTVSSRQTSGEEVIDYKESINIEDSYTINIDIFMLQSQIKALDSDSFTVHFGKPNAIKLEDGLITSVIGLMQI